MTRVDFYVVSDAGPDAVLRVAARLTDKARASGHRLFIHAASEAQAEQLDQLLWSFRPGSFVPHARADQDPTEAVVIGWGQDPGEHNDVMINLAGEAPPFFSRFARVAEVVTADEQQREAQRAAWRFYRDRGYPLHKHDL